MGLRAVQPPDNPHTLTPKEAGIIARVCAGDGWSIKDPKAFAGVNQRFLDANTHTHTSDLSDHKQTVYHPTTEEPLTDAHGIYTLDILSSAVHLLGLKYEHKIGRGFRAAAYGAALRRFAERYAHIDLVVPEEVRAREGEEA